MIKRSVNVRSVNIAMVIGIYGLQSRRWFAPSLLSIPQIDQLNFLAMCCMYDLGGINAGLNLQIAALERAKVMLPCNMRLGTTSKSLEDCAPKYCKISKYPDRP